MNINLDPDLFHFLTHAPKEFKEGEKIKKFQLKNGDYVHCVLWNMHFYITGTDIVKILVWRFQNAGRQLVSLKKFEEGIFSDLRNLKPGVDSTLEGPRSEFLEFLYKNGCIRTQKKQKVFFWFSVPHDALFCDALERDLRRETNLLTYSKYLNNFKQPLREMRLMRQNSQIQGNLNPMNGLHESGNINDPVNMHHPMIANLMKKNSDSIHREFGYVPLDNHNYTSIPMSNKKYNSPIDQLRAKRINSSINRFTDKKMLEKIESIGQVLKSAKKDELLETDSDTEQNALTKELNEKIRNNRDAFSKSTRFSNTTYLRNLNNSSLFNKPESEIIENSRNNSNNLPYDPYQPINPPESFQTRNFSSKNFNQPNSMSLNHHSSSPNFTNTPQQTDYHPSHFMSRFNTPPDQFISGPNKTMKNFTSSTRHILNHQNPDSEYYKPEIKSEFEDNEELFGNTLYQNEIDVISSQTNANNLNTNNLNTNNLNTNDVTNTDYHNNDLSNTDYHNNDLNSKNSIPENLKNLPRSNSPRISPTDINKRMKNSLNNYPFNGELLINNVIDSGTPYNSISPTLKKNGKYQKRGYGPSFNGGYAIGYNMNHDGPYSMNNPSYLENVKMAVEMEKNRNSSSHFTGQRVNQFSDQFNGQFNSQRDNQFKSQFNMNNNELLYPLNDVIDENTFDGNDDILQLRDEQIHSFQPKFNGDEDLRSDIINNNESGSLNNESGSINNASESINNESKPIKHESGSINNDLGEKKTGKPKCENEEGDYISPDMIIPNNRDNGPQK
ncbi:Transcription factor steA [Dictyocoela muelleri]|nr:Transcription factor steA [Dictyocoela muelleri]